MNRYNTFILLILSCVFACASDLISPHVIKENAHKIDRLVAANFRENEIKIPEVTDDATFLKRAFLVSAGRIPTPMETLQFLELEADNKRELLADYLYSSDAYKSHFTNWLFDLLTITERSATGKRQNNYALIKWITEAVETGMPWDQFTRTLLSTTGSAWDHGAAGYYAKDLDNPADNLSNTVRAFLGVRIECAQCHDDPFQEWERMDFYQLMAFVEGGDAWNLNAPRDWERNGKSTLFDRTDQRYLDDDNTINNVYTYFSITISRIAKAGVRKDKGYGRVKLPLDYQYNDGDPGEYVSGRAPFGDKVKTKKKDNDPKSLEKFANWIVSDKTEQFAQTIALRMWERVMGISLTPTTGDYVDSEETHFPNLINLLSKIVNEYDYDLVTFQKTLMLTKTFQFTSSEKNLVNGSKNALAGRRVNRMTAEQLWDSMLSLYSNQPEQLGKRMFTDTYYINGVKIMKFRELVDKISPMSIAQYDKFVKKLFDEKIKQAPEKFEEGADFDYFKTSSRDYAYTSARKGLVRASELRSPERPRHFLSMFGQSQRRAAIDEASQEGTVTQALELLNGSVQRNIVHNRKSALNQALGSSEMNHDQLLKTIFLVVLNRLPTSMEVEVLLPMLKEGGKDVHKDIVAGLIMSQEFYFIY